MAKRLRILLVFCLGFTALLLLACGILLHRSIRNYHAYVVLSGSMQPAIPKGSVVLSKAGPSERYRPGDIAVFHAPSIRSKFPVVHRITKMYPNLEGVMVFETKGDANSNGDPWQLPTAFLQGKVVAVAPWLGYVMQAATHKLGFLVLASCLFLFVVLREIWYLGTVVRRIMRLYP